MKASAGQAIGKRELAHRSGLSFDSVSSLLSGLSDEESLRSVAAVLSLNAEALVAMAEGSWYPSTGEPEVLRCYNTLFPAGYEGMTVNSFLLWDASTMRAVAFDTGANADQMLADLADLGLKLGRLFLTHTHRDHVAAHQQIAQVFDDLEIFVPEREDYPGAQTVRDGDIYELGPLRIEARLTDGHSPGGTTYVINGLESCVAIVGDALFSLSIGGAARAYELALKKIRQQILSLPGDTLICPGHGPMTTVADECERNPFFARG